MTKERRFDQVITSPFGFNNIKLLLFWLRPSEYGRFFKVFLKLASQNFYFLFSLYQDLIEKSSIMFFWALYVGLVVGTTSAEDIVHGGRSLSANNTKLETMASRDQQIGIRRSVHQPYEPCFKQFFLNNRPPSGFRQDLTNIRYICQQAPGFPKSFYATMYDQKEGIAVYSAYVITPRNANNFGAATRPAGQEPAWIGNPGITLQGTRQLYALPAGMLRGQLVPAETFSFTQKNMVSTFTYTNAVPQPHGYKGDEWKVYERRIRRYATAVCRPAGGNLYLLTGTSRAHLTGQFKAVGPAPRAVQNPVIRFPNPAIVIPNSIWTAGCCVVGQDRVRGAFAVIGNNVEAEAQIFMSYMRVDQLQDILHTGVTGLGGYRIDLFPGSACGAAPNHVANLPLTPPPPPPPTPSKPSTPSTPPTPYPRTPPTPPDPIPLTPPTPPTPTPPSTTTPPTPTPPSTPPTPFPRTPPTPP